MQFQLKVDIKLDVYLPLPLKQCWVYQHGKGENWIGWNSHICLNNFGQDWQDCRYRIAESPYIVTAATTWCVWRDNIWCFCSVKLLFSFVILRSNSFFQKLLWFSINWNFERNRKNFCLWRYKDNPEVICYVHVTNLHKMVSYVSAYFPLIIYL